MKHGTSIFNGYVCPSILALIRT